MKKIALFSLLVLLVAACSTPVKETNEGDILLAQVHNKKLHVSDMPGMFPKGATASDSVLIIDNYVRRWVRDAVLMHEAEKNVPQDLNIDKLVRDYRASLIRHNYEDMLVNSQLDSVVTEIELTDYYEKHKQQFQLEAPVMRCLFLKFPSNHSQKRKVQDWWANADSTSFELLQSWSKTNAPVSYLNDSLWYKVSEIASYLPKGTITEDNVAAKKDFRQDDGEYTYYFKMMELVKRREIPPLSYVEGQVRKHILHRRQNKLLEDLKESMFSREMSNNNIQIYQYKSGE